MFFSSYVNFKEAFLVSVGELKIGEVSLHTSSRTLLVIVLNSFNPSSYSPKGKNRSLLFTFQTDLMNI